MFKNYIKYRKVLTSYAKAIKIRIVYAPDAGDGSYIPARRKIRIDPDLTESSQIATILHELGHVLDDAVVPPGNVRNKIQAAYGRIYTKNFTKQQRQVVLRCEKRAWNYGRAIASILNIKLGQWYDKEEKEALDAYRH